MSYLIRTSFNPDSNWNDPVEYEALPVTLTGQPDGKRYYQVAERNEHGVGPYSNAFAAVSVAAAGETTVTNGINKLTLSCAMPNGADTLHLQGRMSGTDIWNDVYTGPNTNIEIIDPSKAYKYWRYYGTYGSDFTGNTGPVCEYTRPDLSGFVLNMVKSGNDLIFTYEGADDSLIVELWSNTGGRQGGFDMLSKSLIVSKPASDTAYHAVAYAGLTKNNSNTVNYEQALFSGQLVFNNSDSSTLYGLNLPPAGYVLTLSSPSAQSAEASRLVRNLEVKSDVNDLFGRIYLVESLLPPTPTAISEKQMDLVPDTYLNSLYFKAYTAGGSTAAKLTGVFDIKITEA